MSTLDGTSPETADRDRVLDVLSVLFGQTLRRHSVAASPAEVIEIRRTLAIVGAADLTVLRAALRSVCVKYAHEDTGFDRAYEMFFAAGGADHADQPLPRIRGAAAELPEDVVWDDEFVGAARRIGADEHTDEIGELMIDDPDTAERNAESAHREENDFTVSSGSEQLGVDPDTESVAGGITYTVEIEEADSGSVGELVGSATRVRGTPLGLTDAAAILAALDGYDARRAYGTDGAEGLDDRRRAELERALTAFIDALAARLDAELSVIADDESPPQAASDQAEIDRACHRLVQRMRGAPRRVARRGDRGMLDIRRTMRASVTTDGVPLQLWRRQRTPGPVRLLILVDVSLSVRPVTGFILRLAQTLHRMGDRCEVVAFVDRPVLVTTALRAAHADNALAAVLAADGLDLAATSDYGTMWDSLLEEYGDLVTSRTSVLVVGDARSNGFDPRPDLFAEVSRRAHRVAWVTPEPTRYWTQTGCAMADYADHCAKVVAARDGTEMLSRADDLGSGLS
ncbi:MadC family VWA domain-containing protein [Gordonia sp. NPDC003424]